MQVNLNDSSRYIVIAGEGNNLNRYKIQGSKVQEMFRKFERVVYIGLLQGF
jgi:hypothetical protein